MKEVESLLKAICECEKSLALARTYIKQLKQKERAMKWQKALTVIWNFIIALALLFFIFVERGNAYTYDGAIDPKVVNEYQCQHLGTQGVANVFGCEKDGHHVVVWVYNGTIVQIAYLINGKTHIFTLNKNNHYQQTSPVGGNSEKTTKKQV